MTELYEKYRGLEGNCGAVWIRSKDKRLSFICDLDYNDCFAGQETHELAVLMSAAPDLLEALEAVLPYFKMKYSRDDSVADLITTMAETAIAKAKGVK